MAAFPFNDLHSFKDYVGFVRMCAPDDFPDREWLPADEQWTLDLAFQGLREGHALAVKEKGPRPEFDEFQKLVDEAYGFYRSGNMKDGFRTLDKAQKILKGIRTQ
jgi:hypothetical protein